MPCGGALHRRADDSEETILNRLKVYAAQTAPLIDYYGRAHKLASVDGNGSVQEVRQRLLQALGEGSPAPRRPAARKAR